MAQDDELMGLLDDLERRIEAAEPTERHRFQAELHRLVERMLASGAPLPDRIAQLDSILTDAAIEARFDNLPV